MSDLTSVIPEAAALAGFITSTLGTPATSVIGAKSLTASYGIFGYRDGLIDCVPTRAVRRQGSCPMPRRAAENKEGGAGQQAGARSRKAPIARSSWTCVGRRR